MSDGLWNAVLHLGLSPWAQRHISHSNAIHRGSPDTLTLGTFTIATTMITEINGDGEIMAREIISTVVRGKVL